jgi:membrane associated rhomboid family serine protease
MLIPWNTDAPIYHFPWATLGLIGINVAAFVGIVATQGEGFEDWILVYGDGWHPLQWVTSAFLHAGLMHLLGNMIFLWAFGLVVEGKLGWWRFLLVYFGLAIFQNAAEQSMSFWFSEGGSLGASAVIYGLMAMCLVWAPENEMSCLLWVGYRPFTFEIKILWLALWYIGVEVFTIWLTGFAVGSSLFHAFGAVLGFGLGVALLRLDKVDCEGWDLFSVMAGRHKPSFGESSVKRRTVSRKSAPPPDDDDAAPSPTSAADRFIRNQEQFRKFLAERNGGAALKLYEKTKHLTGTWELHEKELLQLVELLCAEKLFNEAVPYLEEYLRRFEKRAVQARLKLAQLLIEPQRRPSYASRVLAELPETSLPEQYQKLRTALQRKAQAMIDDGVLELEGRAW